MKRGMPEMGYVRLRRLCLRLIMHGSADHGTATIMHGSADHGFGCGFGAVD